MFVSQNVILSVHQVLCVLQSNFICPVSVYIWDDIILLCIYMKYQDTKWIPVIFGYWKAIQFCLPVFTYNVLVIVQHVRLCDWSIP